MKIAFLFLIISDIYHEPNWKRFFKGHEPLYSIYVHSKNPMLANSFFKRYEIPTKVPTTWQNTMHAQIELLKEALKDKNNQKFVFLSESTIPLKPFDYVYHLLIPEPKSQFWYFKNPHRERTFSPISRKKVYKNSQWVVLNRKHAELMAQDNEIIHIFKQYYFDNEHYPSTFLALHDLLHEEVVKRDTTFVHWPRRSNSPHPHTFSYLVKDQYLTHLISAIQSNNLVFARKFSKACDLALLDNYLDSKLIDS